MSLINDMLRDIEAKRPDDPTRHALQREIRALPPGKRGPGPALKAAGLLGVLATLGAAAFLAAPRIETPNAGPVPPPPPATLVAPPPIAVAPVAEPAVGAPPAPPPASPAAEMAPSATPPVTSPTVAAVPALVAPVATTPAATPSAAMPRLAPPSPSPEKRPAQLAAALPAAPILGVPDPLPAQPAAAAKDGAAAPSGPVRIEKSPFAPSANERAEAELRRAENALAAGRSGEAQDFLRAALKIDPAHVAARQALLRQLLGARQMDEVAVVLQEGLESLPKQTGWAVSLARLQLEQGDLVAADRTLERSQAHAEANADYAGFQGHVKSRLGAQQQAIAHYQRATRLAPGEGRWWLGLGLAFEADGRIAEAKEALRRAIATGTLNNGLVAVAEQHLR